WARETIPVEYALSRPSRVGRDIWQGRFSYVRAKPDPTVTSGLRRWGDNNGLVAVHEVGGQISSQAAANSFVFASQWDDALLRHVAETQPRLVVRTPRREPEGFRKPGTVR